MGDEDRRSSSRKSSRHSSRKKSRSRSSDRDDDIASSNHSRSNEDRKKRLARQSVMEQDAKARAKSDLKSGTVVGARSSKDSLGSSEHGRKERLARQSVMEQDAKARAKSDLKSGTVVGARSSKDSLGSSEHGRKERLARQSVMEQDAKARAKSDLKSGTVVGPRSTKDSSGSTTRERQDREAKARAKGSGKSSVSTVGAFSETKERDAGESKRRRANSTEGEGRSSSGRSPTRTSPKSSTSKAGYSNTGNMRAGVYAASNNSPRRSKEEGGGRPQSSSTPPPTLPPTSSRSMTSNTGTITADVAHDNDVMPVEAKPIEDTEDADRERLLNLEVQNGQIRLQMQEIAEKQEEEENERMEEISMMKKHRKKIIAAVVGVVIIIGGVIGYIFTRPTDPLDSEITVIAVTDSPTTSPPTESPSFSPTTYAYPKPSPSECTAIQNQSGTSGQESMETRSYGVNFEVILFSEDVINSDWYEQLLTGLRDKFAMSLTCCGDTRRRNLSPLRRLQVDEDIRCVIANAVISATAQDTWTSCGTTCFQVSTGLELYLKGDESKLDVLRLIDDVITGYKTIATLVELDLNPAVFKSVDAKDIDL